MAATHDLELSDMLGKTFNNYHFSEKIRNNQIVFDYRLNEGKCNTTNAINLLGVLGYKKELVKSARSTAKNFMKTGLWKFQR